jgi:hypothetical protein
MLASQGIHAAAKIRSFISKEKFDRITALSQKHVIEETPRFYNLYQNLSLELWESERNYFNQKYATFAEEFNRKGSAFLNFNKDKEFPLEDYPDEELGLAFAYLFIFDHLMEVFFVMEIAEKVAEVFINDVNEFDLQFAARFDFPKNTKTTLH